MPIHRGAGSLDGRVLGKITEPCEMSTKKTAYVARAQCKCIRS